MLKRATSLLQTLMHLCACVAHSACCTPLVMKQTPVLVDSMLLALCAVSGSHVHMLVQAHIQSGMDGLVEQLTRTSTLLAKAGLQPSNRFQMLLAEGHLLVNDLEARPS